MCTYLSWSHKPGEEERGTALRRLAQGHERSVECGLGTRHTHTHTTVTGNYIEREREREKSLGLLTLSAA